MSLFHFSIAPLFQNPSSTKKENPRNVSESGRERVDRNPQLPSPSPDPSEKPFQYISLTTPIGLGISSGNPSVITGLNLEYGRRYFSLNLLMQVHLRVGPQQQNINEKEKEKEKEKENVFVGLEPRFNFFNLNRGHFNNINESERIFSSLFQSRIGLPFGLKSGPDGGGLFLGTSLSLAWGAGASDGGMSLPLMGLTGRVLTTPFAEKKNVDVMLQADLSALLPFVGLVEIIGDCCGG